MQEHDAIRFDAKQHAGDSADQQATPNFPNAVPQGSHEWLTDRPRLCIGKSQIQSDPPFGVGQLSEIITLRMVQIKGAESPSDSRSHDCDSPEEYRNGGLR